MFTPGEPAISEAVRAIISKPLHYDDSELMKEEVCQPEYCDCDGFCTGMCRVRKERLGPAAEPLRIGSFAEDVGMEARPAPADLGQQGEGAKPPRDIDPDGLPPDYEYPPTPCETCGRSWGAC